VEQCAAVQGDNVRAVGLISIGESWHNNPHAFPGSARLGLHPGEADLGWLLIRALERAGLAWDIVTPERLPYRPALRPVRHNALLPAPPIAVDSVARAKAIIHSAINGLRAKARTRNELGQ